MEYFSKVQFENDLKDYYRRPTVGKMETIVATYLMPLCRRYAAAGYVRFVYADQEEAAQVAAIKCWEKILCFRRITSPKKDGSALAYFDRIAYHAMLGFEKFEAKRLAPLVSIDA